VATNSDGPTCIVQFVVNRTGVDSHRARTVGDRGVRHRTALDTSFAGQNSASRTSGRTSRPRSHPGRLRQPRRQAEFGVLRKIQRDVDSSVREVTERTHRPVTGKQVLERMAAPTSGRRDAALEPELACGSPSLPRTKRDARHRAPGSACGRIPRAELIVSATGLDAAITLQRVGVRAARGAGPPWIISTGTPPALPDAEKATRPPGTATNHRRERIGVGTAREGAQHDCRHKTSRNRFT